MNEIKIEAVIMTGRQLGLKPKDRFFWLYRALDSKTGKYLHVIVDSQEKPDEETEKKIYAHILTTFKENKIWGEK